ncbi:hypothetical protein GCM10023237_67530 [Streptomyces coeruleoprunus]
MEVAAVTAVLGAVICCMAEHAGASHRRVRRAEWDRTWRPHPAPGSWCTGLGRHAFPHH